MADSVLTTPGLAELSLKGEPAVFKGASHDMIVNASGRLDTMQGRVFSEEHVDKPGDRCATNSTAPARFRNAKIEKDASMIRILQIERSYQTGDGITFLDPERPHLVGRT
jgi:hypothetical protein